MSRILFKGKVLYLNSLPVPGAEVNILDKDLGGDGDDILWSGRTDLDGSFQGRTREWADRNTISAPNPLPVGPRRIAVDVPDVLSLWFRVKKSGETHSGPFLRVSDTVSAPIMTPWPPLDVGIRGTLLTPTQGPVADAHIALYTLDPCSSRGIRKLIEKTTDSQGRFSGIVSFAPDFPAAVFTSLAFWYEARKGSDRASGVFFPGISENIIVPWGLSPSWVITDHGPDVGRFPSNRGVFNYHVRTKGTMFNFASVRPPAGEGKRFHYTESPPRFAFQLKDGIIQFREAAHGGNFQGPWVPIKQPCDGAPQAVSFHQRRSIQKKPAPPFDMFAVGGNRVFAKEKETDRFYFTILAPLFWQFADPGRPWAVDEIEVPGIYFKLDPENAVPGADASLTASQLDGNFNGHPSSVRFPVYKALLPLGGGMMAVRKRAGLWFQLDARTPAACLSEIPGKFPSEVAIRYRHALVPALTSEGRVIASEAILDLGVGSVHLHETYAPEYGGEMQPLLTQPGGIPFFLYVYQFFNGQVRDGDGFVDGTCNYYALVRLRNPAPDQQKYALLFIDEQSVFSRRWRAVDPDDCEPSGPEQWTGLQPNFLFSADLKSRPALYGFDRRRYWCPLRAGLVSDESRLAVARQMIAVNGRDGARHEIYTINYSWGTMDRTWRWRSLPTGTVPVTGPGRDPDKLSLLPHPVRPSVYPQTLALRDDGTLLVKGTLSGSPSPGRSAPQAGRYFQKFLPADLKIPSPATGAGRKPGGFSHSWRFVEEKAFSVMDRFSRFGVYEAINGRSQFYQLEISSADHIKVQEGAGAPWEDIDHTLNIHCPHLDWAALSTLSIDRLLESLAPPLSPVQSAVPSPSMFNPSAAFIIGEKPGAGFIATFYDKRDDDLIPFANPLPIRVRLKSRRTGDEIQVRFKAHCNQLHSPRVKRAVVKLVASRRVLREVRLLFTLPDRVFVRGRSFVPKVQWEVCRVAAGALDGRNLTPVVALDVPREGHFQSMSGSRDYEYRFEPDACQADLFARLFTASAAPASGATVWFENVVGQKETAEEIIFQKA